MAGPQAAPEGVNSGSRSQSYKRRRAWAVKKKHGGKFPEHPKKERPERPEHKGRFYPGDDVKQPLNRRIVRRPTKLRESITPGTVLILLAGRFKGKRVVFLQQLPSGLLLVCGPFKINGVPARRVNQAYVIATSTKIELPSDLDTSKFDDDFFKAAEKDEGSNKGGMFAQDEKPNELSQEYLDAQKSVNSALLKAIPSDYKGYLGTRFSLKDGDRPHLMKF